MTRECHVCGADSEKSWRCSECGADLAGREENDIRGGRDVLADGGIDVYQWVLDNVHEYPAKSGSNWGSRGNLVHHGRKVDGVSPDDVEDAITRAVENDDLLSWHGLLARAEIETLREIIRVETEEHDITRSILVSKCNKLISKKKQERNVAADGGVALEQCTTHDLVMRALEDLDDQEAADGIPTDDVVEWVTERTESTSADVHDAIEWLKRHGEIYRPAADHLRRTSPGDGWSA